jgi:hypothetical protein
MPCGSALADGFQRAGNCVAASAVWLALAAPPALAQGSGSEPSGYYVTFVARYCPAYTDIFANRARDDIVESLEDLGPDTQYSGDWAGPPINPAYEEIPPQTACSPLPTRWSPSSALR